MRYAEKGSIEKSMWDILEYKLMKIWTGKLMYIMVPN